MITIINATYKQLKLSNTQLKKLKDAIKDNTGTTLQINFKMFDGNDLLHELSLTTGQKCF